MRRRILALVLVLCLSHVVAASDTTRVVPPLPAWPADSLSAILTDSSRVSDSVSALLPPQVHLKPFRRLTPLFDSLLLMMNGTDGDGAVRFDLPQSSSHFDYDPLLFRFSSSHWGEFETVYPAGLSPSQLSRVDPLVGDESFANPVPSPGSEEFLRQSTTDRYYLLSPTLSGLGSPFGRPFVVYRQERKPEIDTSRSQIFVTHGTGGFANTAFTLVNRFGPLGVTGADGTFIRRNADYSYTGTKLNRLRLVSRPQFARDLDVTVGLSLNRLNGDKSFRPQSLLFYGNLYDHYTAVSTQVAYYHSETVNYRASLAYRNDDQRATLETLDSHQRFQSTDLHFVTQHSQEHQSLEFGGNLRYLRYTENQKAHNVVYYNLGITDLLTVSDRLYAFGSLAVRGSTDLKVKPAATVTLDYRFDSSRSVALSASRGVLMPQPEMSYLRAITANLSDSIADYHIGGSDQLESGHADAVELILRGPVNHYVDLQLRSGFFHLSQLPLWTVDYTTYLCGDYQATTVDRNLFFGSVVACLTLPKGIFGRAVYGFRSVYKDGVDLTEGPQHVASGYAGIRFPIHKLKIMVSAAVGGRVRSLTNQYLNGESDDARFLTEAYLSFDLKSFHFFWNYANLLDVEYYSGGFRQPARSVWWGFTWTFVD